MKKDTKKVVLVLFLALTMFFSSAAWIIVGSPTPQQTSNPNEIPETLVVEGILNESVTIPLLQRGYSVMEWHSYEGCCPDLTLFVEGLPAEVENQLIVQKIADSNYSWATVKSLRGEQTWNVTQINELLNPLCDVLLKPPIECGFMKFNTTTENETNFTENTTTNLTNSTGNSTE